MLATKSSLLLEIYLWYIYDIHIYESGRLDIASEKVCDCTMASVCSLDIAFEWFLID